jgi:putative NIF3 family GTP cyclohydrolase 1 type 2
VPGIGTFRPGEGAQPVIGTIGRVEQVPETRVEMVLPRARRTEVMRALRAAHPYEEPAFDLLELSLPAETRGIGRVGQLARPEPLRDFVDRVAAGLPGTAAGVRAAGELDRPVRTVAVCGGAGDSLLDAVRRAGADVYVTADLRHHPAAEALAEGGCALVDAAHWATEWPWLPQAQRQLGTALREGGATVETRVSRVVSDPWTRQVPMPASS